MPLKRKKKICVDNKHIDLSSGMYVRYILTRDKIWVSKRDQREIPLLIVELIALPHGKAPLAQLITSSMAISNKCIPAWSHTSVSLSPTCFQSCGFKWCLLLRICWIFFWKNVFHLNSFSFDFFRTKESFCVLGHRLTAHKKRPWAVYWAIIFT